MKFKPDRTFMQKLALYITNMPEVVALQNFHPEVGHWPIFSQIRSYMSIYGSGVENKVLFLPTGNIKRDIGFLPN